MSDHYDALETRDPEAREHAVFERLPKQLAHAKAHAIDATAADGLDHQMHHGL